MVGPDKSVLDRGSANFENMATHKDKVSLRIKAIRALKGISGADVAKLLNIDRSNYSRMEKRGEKLTIEQLERIAAILEVPLVDLIVTRTPEDVDADQQTLIQQKKRIDELEDRLSDKQKIIDVFEDVKETVITYIQDIIWNTGVELGLCNEEKLQKSIAEIEIETAKNRLPEDPRLEIWGDTTVNLEGEKVLLYLDQSLTFADLILVYEHIKKTQEDFYEFNINLVFQPFMIEGLIKDVLMHLMKQHD